MKYEIDVKEAEELLRIMGYDWTNHYEEYGDFIANLAENLHFNLNEIEE